MDTSKVIERLFLQFPKIKIQCIEEDVADDETYLIFSVVSRYQISSFYGTDRSEFYSLVKFMEWMEDKGDYKTVQLLGAGWIENILPNREIIKAIKDMCSSKLYEDINNMEKAAGY